MTKTKPVPLKNVTQWMIVGTFVGNNSLFSRTKQYEPFYQTIENELIRALIITIRSHQVTTETRCHSRSKAWVSERRKKSFFFWRKNQRCSQMCFNFYPKMREREKKCWTGENNTTMHAYGHFSFYRFLFLAACLSAYLAAWKGCWYCSSRATTAFYHSIYKYTYICTAYIFVVHMI